MSDKIKQAIDDIPIPAILHERGLMGIHQAKEEWDAGLAIPMRKNRIRNRIVAASLIVLLSIGATIFNPHLSAAVQKALQFIPGIGVVQSVDSSIDFYMLTEPVDIELTNTTATVTTMLVQNDTTTIEMLLYADKFYNLNIVSESGKVYENSSLMTQQRGDFSYSHVTYTFYGHVDIKDQAQMFFEDSPNETFIIPLSKVDSIDSLNAIGESMEIHDLAITAIPTPAGRKGRIFLYTEDSNRFRYSDGFAVRGDLILKEDISIMDEFGNNYPIEYGIPSTFKDIYFNLGSSDVKKYTLTIPQLRSIGRDEVKFSINIPDAQEGQLNQTFNIAGYTVELTGFRKLKSPNNKDRIEIYVKMPNTLQLNHSLKDFTVVADKSYSATTGVLKSLLINYDPDKSTKLDVTVYNPIIDMKGPWKFEIDADKFKSQRVIDSE